MGYAREHSAENETRIGGVLDLLTDECLEDHDRCCGRSVAQNMRQVCAHVTWSQVSVGEQDKARSMALQMWC